MKKTGSFQLLLYYIRERWTFFLCFACIYLVMIFMMTLYRLAVTAVIYSLFISILPVFFLLLFDLLRFRRRYREIECYSFLLREEPEAMPAGNTPTDRALTEIINHMGKRVRHEIKQGNLTAHEQTDYYTLWVHQIKTPIAAARMILQSNPDEHSAALKQELFKIERYSEMALGFIRIESLNADFQFKQHAAYDIVRQAVKKYSTVFIYQRLSLELEPFPNRILTDEKWLLFALEQILSNALKYTKTGKITITMDENDVLSIRDTGIGISQEDLPRIFEKGFTGYNGRVNKTSTGLGLYLCKKVLTRLSNRIAIFSDKGRGTVVKLYLHRETFTPND